MRPFIGTYTNHVPEVHYSFPLRAVAVSCYGCVGLRWAGDWKLVAVWKCGGLIVLGARIVSI